MLNQNSVSIISRPWVLQINRETNSGIRNCLKKKNMFIEDHHVGVGYVTLYKLGISR